MTERGLADGSFLAGPPTFAAVSSTPPSMVAAVANMGISLPPSAAQQAAMHQYTTVSFLCQRCLQPLRLESSLKEIGKQAYTEIRGMVKASTDKKGVSAEEPPAGIPVQRVQRTIAPLAEDMLWEDTGKVSLHQANQIAARLFEQLSSCGDQDHPLCEECTDTLVEELDAKIREAEEEGKIYSDFLHSIKDGSAVDPEEWKSIEQELEQLKLEEASLLEKLQGVEEERLRLGSEEKEILEEMKELDVEEERYWKEFNEYQRQLQDFHEEQSSVERKYKNASAQLERLKKTNVFNDAFHIWHDGHFGTINNFRLGRLPSVPVEWNEINAAWGQTILLLFTMANRLNFAFQRYRLVPNGSFSRLERIGDGGTASSRDLPLYSSGGVKFGFGESRFDQAMVAFLDCLQQLKDHIESKDPHFKLPYKIDGDRIGDMDKGGDKDGSIHASVKMSGNDEVLWTKALKHMLTNLKWCLAWVCKEMG